MSRIVRRHVLNVYRYIERNPVRADMTNAPENYAWSSVHANLRRRFDSLVTPHACWRALGESTASRVVAYRDWLHAGEDAEELRLIRAHLIQQRAYGDARSQAMTAKTLNRPVVLRSAGRPKLRDSAAN